MQLAGRREVILAVHSGQSLLKVLQRRLLAEEPRENEVRESGSTEAVRDLVIFW